MQSGATHPHARTTALPHIRRHQTGSIPKTLVPPLRSAVILALILAGALSAAISTLEDLALGPESHWNGSDGSGGYPSGDAFFTNDYDVEWDFWAGFAYSNRTDVENTGTDGQYTAIAGSGQGGSANYAVAFVGWEAPPTVEFAEPQGIGGLYVTNSSYAYFDMLQGSPFSKKFGGETGDEEDWFKLTITGLNVDDEVTGTVEFYLADFRDADSSQDYILDAWAFIDLASLGVVKSLQFSLDSSDQGAFGMNTPAYFCLDTIVPWREVATFEDLTLTPESHWNGSDGSGGYLSGDAFFANDYNADWDFWTGFAYSNETNIDKAGMDGQYTAIPGSGQNDSTNYAVAFVGWEAPPAIIITKPKGLSGLYVTNSSYAYNDMLQGSALSKKFGGETGDEEDWFKLTITGLDADDESTGTVEFYLADFRAADSSQDYILDKWAFVDLASLGVVSTLQFSLDSSDQGAFGMNTPAYFCLDTILGAADGVSDIESEDTESVPAVEETPDRPLEQE